MPSGYTGTSGERSSPFGSQRRGKLMPTLSTPSDGTPSLDRTRPMKQNTSSWSVSPLQVKIFSMTPRRRGASNIDADLLPHFTYGSGQRQFPEFNAAPHGNQEGALVERVNAHGEQVFAAARDDADGLETLESTTAADLHNFGRSPVK